MEGFFHVYGYHGFSVDRYVVTIRNFLIWSKIMLRVSTKDGCAGGEVNYVNTGHETLPS